MDIYERSLCRMRVEHMRRAREYRNVHFCKLQESLERTAVPCRPSKIRYKGGRYEVSSGSSF